MSMRNPAVGPAVLVAVGMTVLSARADRIELLNEKTLDGQVTRRTAESVSIATPSGSGTVEATIPTVRIHAVTVAGKRSVVNPKPTRADIEALIQKAGTTPPDWWDSVPLQYPPTLDLTWPVPKPKSPWDPSRNMGQYIWSVINENPGKWRSGAKLLHHLLSVNKDNPPALKRTIGALATVYERLLQDWARAAFWLRKSIPNSPDSFGEKVRLAECYFRLGSKSMAVEELREIEGFGSSGIVKLWSDMGEVEEALSAAETLAFLDDGPEDSWLVSGDACRLNGDYARALQFYEKVLRGTTPQKWVERTKQRARDNIAAVKAFNLLDLRRVPDGTYVGSSISYTGPLEVTVAVKQGRILTVRVTKHTDKQYYGALTETPRQIVERQSLQGIDAVTSATITCEAIVNATAKALAKAKPSMTP